MQDSDLTMIVLNHINAFATDQPVLSFLLGFVILRAGSWLVRLGGRSIGYLARTGLALFTGTKASEIESIVLNDLASGRFFEGGAGELRGLRVKAIRRMNLNVPAPHPPVSEKDPLAVAVYLLNPNAADQSLITTHLSLRARRWIARAVDAARVEHERVRAELERDRVRNLLSGTTKT